MTHHSEPAEAVARALHEHFGTSSTTTFTAREAGRQAASVVLRHLSASPAPAREAVACLYTVQGDSQPFMRISRGMLHVAGDIVAVQPLGPLPATPAPSASGLPADETIEQEFDAVLTVFDKHMSDEAFLRACEEASRVSKIFRSRPLASPPAPAVESALVKVAVEQERQDVDDCLRVCEESSQRSKLPGCADIASLREGLLKLRGLRDESRIRASLDLATATSAPTYVVNCCNCGRIIDTREESEGGDQWGHELSDDRWVCSPGCFDAVTDPDATPPASSESAQVKEAFFKGFSAGESYHNSKWHHYKAPDLNTAWDSYRASLANTEPKP